MVLSDRWSRAFDSFNALHVPLQTGWRCILIPAAECPPWFSHDECRSQLAEDREAFDRLFRPRGDLRTVSGGHELSLIQAFTRQHLGVPHWNLPTDNESIERTLRQSVRLGRLLPRIDRDHVASGRTSIPPFVPQYWRSAGGGAKPRSTDFGPIDTVKRAGGAFGGLDSFSDDAAFSSVQKFAPSNAASIASTDFGDLDVGAFLSNILGQITAEIFPDGGSDETLRIMNQSLVDNGSPGFLDAQPFEYVPDALSDDVIDLAASTQNPGYAAQMLGYDRKTFGQMIHVMKDANDLGGADNVVWHDDGGVYFRDIWIDNMHNYAP